VLLWRERLIRRRPDLGPRLNFPASFWETTTGGVSLASWLLDAYELCAKEEEWLRERKLARKAGLD